MPYDSRRSPPFSQPVRRPSRPVRSSLGLMWEPGLPSDVSPALEVFDAEPGIFGVAHYKCITFGMWSGGADLAIVRRVGRLGQHMRKLYPEGHSNVTFVRPGCPMPTEEARGVMSHMYNGKVSNIRCMGVLLEGEGFWAGALRAMITELRQRHHHFAPGELCEVDIGPSIPDIAAWLAPAHTRVTGWGISAMQLTALSNHAYATLLEAVEPSEAKRA